MDYEVKLEIFEGPLDLLLHLIHKNEVDIFDIPIATITDQYLEYLDMMKALNVNVAGDFLVMASTLLHIKSKMLLPGLNGEEEEDEDPRVEITRPLLEYMRFKEVAGELWEREMLDRDVFARRTPSYFQETIEDEEPRLDVNLFQLIDAFRQLMEKSAPGPTLKLQLEQWSIKDKIEELMSIIKEKESIFFTEVFEGDRTLSEFVVTFLALLELAHIGFIKIYQPTPKSDIRLVRAFDGQTGAGDV